MAATSAGPRTTGLSTWSTRRGKLVGRQYGGASDRTTNLTQVRSTPLPADACLTARTADVVEGYDGMPTPVTRYEGSIHLAEHRLYPETTTGELAHKGLNQQCSLSGDGADCIHWAGTRFGSNILALEGGPMSQERPFGNSGAEHHPEPDHPRPTEEAAVAVPTPNRFWRMMTDPGFPSPASNPTSFMVTVEAFLGLTSQVQ
ncbi:hypothetical protein GW17_00016119, partial [Ensete ventricosum]